MKPHLLTAQAQCGVIWEELGASHSWVYCE